MDERPEMVEFGRRRVLRVLTAATAFGVAGCTGDEVGGDPEPIEDSATEPETDRADPETTDDGGTEVGEGATEAETTDGDLDLQEANVVGVEFEPSGEGYEFSVTLLHDDDGEDGYADWWQVETVDGEPIGRRELLHAHGTAPFTRSASVEVPDGVTCVVVRGHDQTHEYGGQATLVNFETGATRPVRQGPDRRAFDHEECP